ncbi:hypothetical protein [Paractinoplanes rishiriensis]|uniref:hypothetical protein n=1 Tax=Paractinoplanes rishiriensis TaxID=1050105 RepID=UPI0019428177|nr:hypothetical protein [Actinoplanes rishiriensis]
MTRRRGRDVRGDVDRVGGARDTAPTDAPLQVDFDITVVDGEHGRRLAVLQAQVVLDVLTWLHDHHRAGPVAE